MKIILQKSYTFAVLEYVLVLLNTWKFALFFLAMLVLFTVYIGKRHREKNRIPRINMSEIFLIYLMQRMLSGRKDPGVYMLQLYQAWTHLFPKDGICYFWQTFQPMVLLYKAKTVEPILSSSKILKKGFEYRLIVRLDHGLLSSDIKKWQHHRKLISPTFSAQLLDDFGVVFNKKAILLTEEITKLMNVNQFVKIDALLSNCVLDIVCDTIIGIKETNSKTNRAEYVQAVIRAEKAILDRVYRPWLWPDVIFHRSNIAKQMKKNFEIMDNFVKEVIKEKKMEKLALLGNHMKDENLGVKRPQVKKRLAFLDRLLDIHFQDDTFTMKDIADEVDTFMEAGSVTTYLSASWVLYLLGLHPDIQRKVHEELDQVFGDDISSPITKDHIKELKYLDCVFKETLRLYPPIPYISRTLEEDTIITGFTVPKGTTCGIFLYELHRDPEVFQNPEVFDPDRFLTDKKKPPYAYVPFSAGPRNCIGQHFAKLASMILIATILRRFKVKSMLPLDKIQISMEITLVVKNGLTVTFEPRKTFCSEY